MARINENICTNNSKNINEHKIGDYVVYRQNGICRIVDIRNENFNRTGEATYYVMQSVYNESEVSYIPVNSASLTKHMHHILTVDEINEIIAETENCKITWVDDSKQRIAKFDEIFNNGDRIEILWLVKVLSLHKIEMEKQKRKFYANDERILFAAEKLIKEEFAFVLGISKDEVIPYILNKTHQICDEQN